MRLGIRWVARICAVALGLIPAAVLLARPALAQDEATLASRRVLLDQAEQARTAGDHTRALDLARRAGTIQMTPSVRLFVAEEQSQLGELAGALVSAEACIRETPRTANVSNADVIVQRCREIGASVRARIGYVTVRVPGAPPEGLHVRVAGSELATALIGAPFVVNPGNVSVDATADGMQPFHQEVTVGAGATVDVSVAFVRTPDAPTMTAPATPHVSLPAPPPASERAPQPRGVSAGPFVVMGIGALSVGATVLFYLLRNDAISGCPSNGQMLVCRDTPAFNRAQSAGLYNALTNAGIVTSGVAFGVGLVWLIVDRATAQPPRQSGSWHVRPSIGWSAAALVLEGAL